MVKIYTRTGDSGTTSLFGGKRVDKNYPRIELFGLIDEINSNLGILFSEQLPLDIRHKILRIQNELFTLGSDLATPHSVKVKIPRTTKGMVAKLEKEIDRWEEELPMLKNFILPGGTKYFFRLNIDNKNSHSTYRNIFVHQIGPNRNLKTKYYYNIIWLDKKKTGAHLNLIRSLVRKLERNIVKFSKKERVSSNAISYINRLSDWLFVLARYVNKIDNIQEFIWKGRGK